MPLERRAKNLIAKELGSVDSAVAPPAVTLFFKLLSVANKLHLVIDRARDSPRLGAGIPLESDAVVAIDLVRYGASLALFDRATLVTSTGRRRSERLTVALQHGLSVHRACVRPFELARVTGLSERGVAMDVAPVDDLAALRPTTPSPQAVASVLADERIAMIGRARIVERWRTRAPIAVLGQCVVALVDPSGARASAGALARDLDPYVLALRGRRRAGISGKGRVAHERMVGRGANRLVGDAASFPCRGPRVAADADKRRERGECHGRDRDGRHPPERSDQSQESLAGWLWSVEPALPIVTIRTDFSARVKPMHAETSGERH